MTAQLTDDATIEKNAKRVLEYVSPSQVEVFELCPARWYNDSVRGLREPLMPGSAAARGVDIASEVEHYGKTGAVKPDAKFKAMVEAVLPYLSPPSPTVSVEQWVEAETEPGLPRVRGRYDWFDCSQRVWEPGHMRAPLLPDVKSRSDFRYAKTPAELADDTQLNAYATALARRDGYEYVSLRHAYTRTSGKPKGMAVTVTLSREQLEQRFLRTVDAVREMTRWAKERPRTADPLPKNTAACDKYRPHGCPHRALCGFDGSTLNQIRSQKMTQPANGTQTSDLMKRLAERTALKANGGAAPAQQPAAEPQKTAAQPERKTTPTEDPGEKALRQIMSGDLKLDGTGQVFAREGADSGWILRQPTNIEKEAFRQSDLQHKRVEKQIEREETKGTLVTPADAPPRTNQPGDGEPKQEAQADKPKRAPRKLKENPAQGELGAIKEPTVTDPGAEDEIADLREQLRVALYNEKQAQAYAEETHAKLTAALAGGAQPASGPIVYVNCVPTKGAHKGEGVHFEEWLAPICEIVAEDKGVADWRLIQYTAKGDLAAAIRKVISTCPPIVLVSKFSPAADVFLESVIPHASQIIHGV